MSSLEKKGQVLIFEKSRLDAFSRKESNAVPAKEATTAVTELSEARTAANLKPFSDALHDLIDQHIRNGSFQAPQIAAMLVAYARDLVFRSFEGMEPEAKRLERDKLRDCLAKFLQKTVIPSETKK